MSTIIDAIVSPLAETEHGRLVIQLKRTPEETLALLLWELTHYFDVSVSGLPERFRGLISRFGDADRVYELLAGQDARFSAAAQRASGLSGAELDGDPKEAGLRSVFSRLRVGEALPAAVWYAPAPLTVDGIFPSAQQKPGATEPLTEALAREVLGAGNTEHSDFGSFAVLLDTVFRKYLWSLPAVPGGDVSLYDRLKATSAIGSCLLETDSDIAQPYLLLAADFSGIQSYIFSVAHTGVKGVAKRLRARSFFVDVMVQALACELCDRFEVPQGNIMMLTGGKFYLLLPNRPDTEGRLAELRAEADRFLFRSFAGEIQVNMAWVCFGDGGLLDYSSTVTELSRRLRENKTQPFRAALAGEDGWREEAFILQEELNGKKTCPSCRRRLIDRGRELCPECAMQEELGGRLPAAEQLWLSRDGGQYRLWDFCFLSLDRSAARGKLLRVEQLNSWTLSDSLKDTPLGVRLMANHLPRENGEPLTFSDLAERSTGTKRIAVLKADVDNLGYLFADGMWEQERHYGTISRVSSLSRLLDMFFSGYVGCLLKTKYRDVYSVFSGGDDLFLIGPWDVMPELALEIRNAFTRLSGGNPCVTLSAAICAAAPKTNVALLAEWSEEELKQVKNSAPQALYPGKAGRNGVSFLGTVFSWEDLSAQLERVRMLEQTAGSVDSSILRRLGQYSRMYRRFLLDHDVMGLMFEPLFRYDQMRNYEKLNRDAAAPFLDWAREMKRETAQAADYRNVKRDLYFAEMVVTCYLNKTKEARSNGL